MALQTSTSTRAHQTGPAREQDADHVAAKPIQLKTRAVQRRPISGGDTILEPVIDAQAVVDQVQGMFAAGPSDQIRSVNLVDSGISGGLFSYVSTAATTKQPTWDSGFCGGGLGITTPAARVIMTLEITDERPRAAQNKDAVTSVNQTAGTSTSSQASSTTGGKIGGEASGGGGKGTGEVNAANTNQNSATGTGSATSGGGFGTVMEDVTITFNARIETRQTGVGSVFGSISEALGVADGLVLNWSSSKRITGGTAILRKPDPNAPK